jgi:hypothetical protein
MLLGDLIARFDDEAVAEETALTIGDLAMLAELRERAGASGLSVGAYMAIAARRYAEEAPDDEWVTLLGLMARGQDPGAIFLRRAFDYVRRVDGRTGR